MRSTIRPSGSTVEVIKTFTDKEQCREQVRLHLAAGPSLAIQPSEVTEDSYRMPLFNNRVPESVFADVLRLLESLWAVRQPDNTPVRPPTTRAQYHAYVMGRQIEGAHQPAADNLLRSAKIEAERLYRTLALPLGADFVHGDSTLANVVMTKRGPRFIDLSPKPSPPDRELDLAKLIFSGMGFDLGPRRGARLLELLPYAGLPPGQRDLVDYYLATHLVRVLSKEPPAYHDRFVFYSEVLNVVAAK